MFSPQCFHILSHDSIVALRNARIEMLREFFPQSLPWRLGRIQAAFFELAQLPGVFSRTFSAAMIGDAPRTDALNQHEEASPSPSPSVAATRKRPVSRRKPKAAAQT